MVLRMVLSRVSCLCVWHLCGVYVWCICVVCACGARVCCMCGVLYRWCTCAAHTYQPLNDAATAEGFSPVPVINFGNCGVIRCRRCRTYINPFVSWLDAGRRWRCNGCGLLNDTPPDYYCNLDQSGKRYRVPSSCPPVVRA